MDITTLALAKSHANKMLDDFQFDIPQGGGGKEWRLLRTVDITEEVASVTISTDEEGNSFEIESLLIYAPVSVTASGDSQIIVHLSGEMTISTTNGFIGKTAKSVLIESYWSGRRISKSSSSTYDLGSVAQNVTGVRASSLPRKIKNMKIAALAGCTFTAGKFYIYGA